ncbi:EamA family transporter [Clostridium sp. YIM B02515]|uniref:EamA family transporter n=1 Tax=Clostridium rhizosphaerae TaxID=2803861 RepID=A0ABS1TK67_9CLOT|nr:EamA family transporter [Clostridium rhizosphaerae]MBL4938363.1 EamA family transporter [Clostridium rhizosphaerae]
MWKLYAILSAVFAALTSILAKIGIKGVDSNLATAIRTVVIIILAWSIVFATGAQSGITSLSRKSWVFLILSGLATGLSWVFYYKAIAIGKVSQVAPIDKSSIVLTLILSFIILGEKFTAKTLIAGLLITAGTFVMIWK